MGEDQLTVPLWLESEEPIPRQGEPVTFGLPWPQGLVRDDRQFALNTPDSLQTRVLDRWPDGSIRWCLFDFLAHSDHPYHLTVNSQPHQESSLSIANRQDNRIFINTGALKLTLGPDTAPWDLLVDTNGKRSHLRLMAELADHSSVSLGPVQWQLAESGTVRARVTCPPTPLRDATGQDLPIVIFGSIEAFRDLPTLRVELTIRNTQASDHPGGNWDLGNPGYVDVTSLRFELSSAEQPGPAGYRYSTERGSPFNDTGDPLAIQQESSGGDHWQSLNHRTRDRDVPFRRRGYELTLGDHMPQEGRRATPIVVATGHERLLGVTMSTFWENFPKAVTAGNGRLVIDLFPGNLPRPIELQGGEQKTHQVTFTFATDQVTPEPLLWARSPLVVRAAPGWYARSGAIPYLTPWAEDPHKNYLALVYQAIEGNNTFLTKRETIDEYGWRNYGDIYGDHEATRHLGPEPLISHYNNQYDCIAGFLYQYLRSGDRRWWDQATSCADHTCDIDIYHTTSDKAAYNKGLFWHTYHYADADTGTHRSYPKILRRGPQHSQVHKADDLGTTAKELQKAYAVGGGPAASHNYNRGLMLAYFLTGRSIYGDTAIDLARYVIDIEDPSRTVFRFLSREYTGLATESGGGGYHGPGRAVGNSIEALLVGYQLTGDREFLLRAEALIRRVAHPSQDLDRLDLLNAELRWFYTMFLQALGRYLDIKAEIGELDEAYAYGRLTLLHYAKWMAANERPILDQPERLQYPTETWAVQDMRKVEIFQFAARHAPAPERKLYLDKAEWFFDYVVRTLDGFPTKSLCRPVVLMMNFGWSRAWWRQHPESVAPAPVKPLDVTRLRPWRMFVPQKAKAIRRAKLLVVLGGIASVGLVVAGLAWWLLRS